MPPEIFAKDYLTGRIIYGVEEIKRYLYSEINLVIAALEEGDIHQASEILSEFDISLFYRK